jgi:hypothetical protein
MVNDTMAEMGNKPVVVVDVSNPMVVWIKLERSN